jgi:hypothetical protein
MRDAAAGAGLRCLSLDYTGDPEVCQRKNLFYDKDLDAACQPMIEAEVWPYDIVYHVIRSMHEVSRRSQ